MAGLDPAIAPVRARSVAFRPDRSGVDGRVEPGHDTVCRGSPAYVSAYGPSPATTLYDGPGHCLQTSLWVTVRARPDDGLPSQTMTLYASPASVNSIVLRQGLKSSLAVALAPVAAGAPIGAALASPVERAAADWEQPVRRMAPQ